VLSIGYIAISPYIISKNLVGINSGFAGASAAVAENFGIPISPLSWTCIGETLYLGGAGTMILQYTNASGVSVFSVATQYLGAVCLKKFAGSLIAAGIVPGPGQNIQDPEMVVGWSEANAPATWNPTNFQGFVTGAGFAQIGDIADYITYLFVQNSRGIILRTQGVDFVSALASGTDPFDFNHISLAEQGEGCQDTRLATQYDQVGHWVGNSNIYGISSGMNPVGDKIKTRLFKNLYAQAIGITKFLASTSGAFELYDNPDPIVIFLIGSEMYVFDASKGIWMILKNVGMIPLAHSYEGIQFLPLLTPLGGVQEAIQYAPVLAFQNSASPAHGPGFSVLGDMVQTVDGPGAVAGYVLFPQEELLFGRDVTIDGIYASIQGTPGQVVNFSISGTSTFSFTIPVGAVAGTYYDYQIFFDQGVTTNKSPQLRIDIPLSATGVKNQLSFAKITLFGSFDPSQRPV
jgi:hypothetical protein